jgi:hypothetical protein
VNTPNLDDSTLKDFTFSVINEFGEEIELLPGGSDMRVTRGNRVMYGDLLAAFYLRDDIRDEMRMFTEGFHEVIPLHVV